MVYDYEVDPATNETTGEYSAHLMPTEFRTEPLYIAYFNWSRLIVLGIIPFVMLVYLNAKIYQGRRSIHQIIRDTNMLFVKQKYFITTRRFSVFGRVVLVTLLFVHGEEFFGKVNQFNGECATGYQGEKKQETQPASRTGNN